MPSAASQSEARLGFHGRASWRFPPNWPAAFTRCRLLFSGGTLSQSTENGSDTRPPLERIEHAIEYTRDLYAAFRGRGHKTEFITSRIATILGIPKRRVRAINYREKYLALHTSVIDQIEDRFISYIDHEITLSIERTEKLRADKMRATTRRGTWRHGHAESQPQHGVSESFSGPASIALPAKSAA